MDRLPTLFISHGSPMHALDPGRAGKAWQAIAGELAKPVAVLAISAHWEAVSPRLTSAARLETIHDFTGFPAPLYAIRYDAPGSPGLAAKVVGSLSAAGLPAALDPARGIDHGAWVPMRWMYPQVDVPLVQLSVQTRLGAAHMLALGRALSALREEGVLVLGTGHVTHNLRDWRGHEPNAKPLPYVREFSEWPRDAVSLREPPAGCRGSPGADRIRPGALHPEDAVPRRHHAHCAGAAGFHRKARGTGAAAADAPDPVPRCVRTAQSAARSHHAGASGQGGQAADARGRRQARHAPPCGDELGPTPEAGVRRGGESEDAGLPSGLPIRATGRIQAG